MDTGNQIQNPSDSQLRQPLTQFDEHRKNQPIISFEALAFLIGTCVSLLQIVQALDDSDERKVGIFLVGCSICGLGLTIVGRVSFGIEIKRMDSDKFYAKVEYFVVVGALLALMFAVPIICTGIDADIGKAVWGIGIVLMLPIAFAYMGAFENNKDRLLKN